LLTVTTAGCVTLTLAIPYLPGKSYFGFTPLPWSLLVALLAISVAYVAAAEVLKRWFYRGAGMDRTSGET
jgi:Mg2+-importing ATPase